MAKILGSSVVCKVGIPMIWFLRVTSRPSNAAHVSEASDPQGGWHSTCAASAPTSFKQSDNTDIPVVFDTPDGRTYAISRAATCASAFFSDDFRCLELTLTPSAAMTSGLAMPMKASTLFR